MLKIELLRMDLSLLVITSISILLGIISTLILNKILTKYYSRNIFLIQNLVNLKVSFFFIFAFIFLKILSPFFDLERSTFSVGIILQFFLLWSVGAAVFKLINYARANYESKFLSGKKSKSAVTRFQVIQQILKVTTVLFLLAIFLTNFPAVKEVGKGLLVSATVIGGIAVFAAQKFISNMFSSLQILFNSPIQIGDSITVDNEFGVVEEITFNYIVMRIWDGRALILPANYFLEHPVINFTFKTVSLIGIVILNLDYFSNMESIKKKFFSILENTPLWNKKVSKFHVISLENKGIEVRLIASADGPDDVWDLRCHIREELVKFFQKDMPEVFYQIYLRNYASDKLDAENKESI